MNATGSSGISQTKKPKLSGTKVLLINDTKELRDSALTTSLGAAFKLKFAKANADYIVPGITTVALSVIREADIMFEYKRTPTIQRLEKLKTQFKDCYVLVMFETLDGIKRCDQLSSLGKLPPLVLCETTEQACRVVQTFSQMFTKDREKQRLGHLHLLEEHITSRATAQAVLAMIPEAADGQDRRLLQDCYGSIAAIASKSADQILEQTPCSKQTAMAVEQFFATDDREQ